MREGGVLSLLAHRFKVGKEPLTTQALCYLAQSHERIRRSLAALAAHGAHAPELLDSVRFQAESVSALADGRPDIEGAAGDVTLVLIEGKFDAGLTGHQPVSYLERLADGGTLLFVCPARRVRTLLHELTRRAQKGGFAPVGLPTTDERGIRWQQLVPDRALAVVGWATLLDWLAGQLPSEDTGARSDLGQVRGLAVRFEEELMDWTRTQLANPGLDGFGAAFERGYRSAQEAADALKNHEEVHGAGSLGWRMVGNSFYSLAARVGQVTLRIGFSPADWGPSCPTPLQFVVSKKGLAANQLDDAHRAYLKIMDLVNKRLAIDFAGLTFPPHGRQDEYWWGPLPLSFDVPEQEWRADLEDTIAAIVTAVSTLKHA
ncbi:hypothetical protein LNW71_32600 [Streptomyces sp. RKAG290]|nr:hypothetical protein [Streptomyces sp. RKAG290]